MPTAMNRQGRRQAARLLVAIASLLPAAAGGAPALPGVAFPGQWGPPPPGQRFPVWPSGCARFQEPGQRAACFEYVAMDWGRVDRYAAANRALQPARPGERRVVFFGDSITDWWMHPEAGGFFPGKPYVNRGIAGQTTSQMLVRFRQDVIALRPRVVVILAGTNDLAGNSGRTPPETVHANLETMTELARAHGVRVVLASLLPVCDCAVGPDGQAIRQTTARPPEEIRALNGWIARHARTRGHVFLDYHGALAGPGDALRATLTADGLHPNAAGYAVMAPLAERAIARALAGR